MSDFNTNSREEQVDNRKLNAYLISLQKQAKKMSASTWREEEWFAVSKILMPLSVDYLERIIPALVKSTQEAMNAWAETAITYANNPVYETQIVESGARNRAFVLRDIANRTICWLEDKIKEEQEENE